LFIVNPITLKGEHKKTVAIGLRDTQDAIIENNIIRGAEISVDEIGKSSSQQKNNQIK
jgi:hypothetical protein